VNPLINAIVQDRFEEALEEAREIDNVIAMGINSVESMEELTPLLGIPVTVKESIAVKGMTNQAGRVFKTPQIAKSDAPVVEQIKRSGGIILLEHSTTRYPKKLCKPKSRLQSSSAADCRLRIAQSWQPVVVVGWLLCVVCLPCICLRYTHP